MGSSGIMHKKQSADNNQVDFLEECQLQSIPKFKDVKTAKPVMILPDSVTEFVAEKVTKIEQNDKEDLSDIEQSKKAIAEESSNNLGASLSEF